MAFEPGIEFNPTLTEFTTGNCLNSGGGVLSQSFEIFAPPIEYSPGSCINTTGRGMVQPSFEIFASPVEYSYSYTAPPTSPWLPNIFYTKNLVLYTSALSFNSGDTGIVIVSGYNIEFHASLTSPLMHQRVNFFDDTFGPEIVQWRWSFGDGTESTQRQPQHAYTALGTYSPKLEVWSINGEYASTIRNNYITVSIPYVLSYFVDPLQRNNSAYPSYVNKTYLIDKIGSDPYFSNIEKVDRVDILYQHELNRERKLVTHVGPFLTGTTFWSPYAQAGLWKKIWARAVDHEGAVTYLFRDDIGTLEDLTF